MEGYRYDHDDRILIVHFTVSGSEDSFDAKDFAEEALRDAFGLLGLYADQSLEDTKRLFWVGIQDTCRFGRLWLATDDVVRLSYVGRSTLIFTLDGEDLALVAEYCLDESELQIHCPIHPEPNGMIDGYDLALRLMKDSYRILAPTAGNLIEKCEKRYLEIARSAESAAIELEPIVAGVIYDDRGTKADKEEVNKAADEHVASKRKRTEKLLARAKKLEIGGDDAGIGSMILKAKA